MTTSVLITGAAGYLGSMLVDQLMRHPAVDQVIGVDLQARPDHLARQENVRWIQANVADACWSEALGDEPVGVVVHCAYLIKSLYGEAGRRQRAANVDGARRVFEYALRCPSVRRLIHFSTVSAYGASRANSIGARFTEETPLAATTYPYAVDKREIEGLLKHLYEGRAGAKHAVVLRPASISGPYGRFTLKRYGIASTLGGRFPFLVCGRRDWGRQYLHEDDIVALVTMLIQLPPADRLDVLNASPEDYLDAADIGRLFAKRVVLVPPTLLRILFALLWHGTGGRFATPPGAWRFLTYPICVDGTRLTRTLGFTYRYSSSQALLASTGRLAPPEQPDPAAPRLPMVDMR